MRGCCGHVPAARAEATPPPPSGHASLAAVEGRWGGRRAGVPRARPVWPSGWRSYYVLGARCVLAVTLFAALEVLWTNELMMGCHKEFLKEPNGIFVETLLVQRRELL